MSTLLTIIAQYDSDQQAYIRELEIEIKQLQLKNAELTGRLVSYVDTVDQMRLKLILSGALSRPEHPELPVGSP
jgi:hypothetical protein